MPTPKQIANAFFRTRSLRQWTEAAHPYIVKDGALPLLDAGILNAYLTLLDAYGRQDWYLEVIDSYIDECDAAEEELHYGFVRKGIEVACYI